MIQWFYIKSTALISISLLLFSNAFGSELMIHKNGFSAAQKLGVLKVLRDKEGYAVLTNDGIHKVHNHDVDTPLKKMSNEQLAGFLNNGNGTIKVARFNNGEFNLKTRVHGNGGGAIGAAVGVVAGQALVRAACYGPIWIACSFMGPAGAPIAIAAQSVAAVWVEPASIAAGAIIGLAGAAATGPV